MKVLFKTNIDHYKTNCFPQTLSMVPRIGEHVLVAEVFLDYYSNKKLPVRLQVVDVIWIEGGAVVELWYNPRDVETAKLTGTNLL